MDIQMIASAATALLSPYLAKAGEAFAKRAGEKLVDKIGTLYQVIRKQFRGDSYAERTLARLEEKPESIGRQNTLNTVLMEKMEEDSDFAEALRQLVEESRKVGGADIINQQLRISGRAKVKGDVFQIGKLEGSITKSRDSGEITK